jgi:hypothetical protein
VKTTKTHTVWKITNLLAYGWASGDLQGELVRFALAQGQQQVEHVQMEPALRQWLEERFREHRGVLLALG